jgi:hypothetical protein
MSPIVNSLTSKSKFPYELMQLRFNWDSVTENDTHTNVNILPIHKKYKGVLFKCVCATKNDTHAYGKGPFIYFIMTQFNQMYSSLVSLNEW